MNNRMTDTIKAARIYTATAMIADVKTNIMPDTINATITSPTAQYIYQQEKTYANINMFTTLQPHIPNSTTSTRATFTKKCKVQYRDEMGLFTFYKSPEHIAVICQLSIRIMQDIDTTHPVCLLDKYNYPNYVITYSIASGALSKNQRPNTMGWLLSRMEHSNL